MKTRTPIRDLRVVETRQTYLPHLLAIACLWLLAMSMDYADAAAQAHQRATRINAEHTACLQGKWRAVTAQGVELGCLPVQINPPPRQPS